jgi:hypothetical protein
VIEIGDRRWVLAAGRDLRARLSDPEYVCVSYAWGAEVVTHPFEPGLRMSSRTIEAVEAAIRARQPPALWVDALCVPCDDAGRDACLSHMGAIYAGASEVVVVLSDCCSELLKRIRTGETIADETLSELERDDWVTRAWTYQEIVNNARIRFVTMGTDNTAWAEAEEVLNFVGHAIHRFREKRGLDAFELREQHPCLDSLENLVLDWKMSGYLKRSVYQVMSNMYGRRAVRSEDQFFAMMGAINASRQEDPIAEMVAPAEAFMRLCESKGDYSFIYTSAARDRRRGRRWRPAIADTFDAVFPWPTYGDGQSARALDDHLVLDGMWRPSRAPVASVAREFAGGWLNLDTSHMGAHELAQCLFRRLQQAGFSGCGEWLEAESGLFFLQAPAAADGEVAVAVATGVRMPHGAPGLVLERGRSGVYQCLGVGLYVGPVPDHGESISVS